MWSGLTHTDIVLYIEIIVNIYAKLLSQLQVKTTPTVTTPPAYTPLAITVITSLLCPDPSCSRGNGPMQTPPAVSVGTRSRQEDHI